MQSKLEQEKSVLKVPFLPPFRLEDIDKRVESSSYEVEANAFVAAK